MISAAASQVVEAGEHVGVEVAGVAAPVWSQTAGPAVALSGSGTRRTFTAPRTPTGAELTFQATHPQQPAGLNPGFEVDASGWAPYLLTVARVTGVAHSGSASGVLTIPAGSSDVTYYWWADELALSTVSVWVRTPAALSGSLTVICRSRDGDWNIVASAQAAAPATGLAWSRVNLAFAPAAHDNELVILAEGVVEPYQAWVDDVSVTVSGSAACTVRVRPQGTWRRVSGAWVPVTARVRP